VCVRERESVCEREPYISIIIIIIIIKSNRCISYPVSGIHGDKFQHERLTVIHNFKKSIITILVATDVAGVFYCYIVILLLSIYISLACCADTHMRA